MAAKFSAEEEFAKVVKRLSREFMYNRCRLYKVRIKKDDELPVLCLKYLNKKDKMKPWDYPDDEDGNATWINPAINLEDDIAMYIVLAKINSVNKTYVPDDYLKSFKGKIIDEIEELQKQLTEIETAERLVKKYSRADKKKKGK